MGPGEVQNKLGNAGKIRKIQQDFAGISRSIYLLVRSARRDDGESLGFMARILVF